MKEILSMAILKDYILSLSVFLVIDMIWLLVISKKLYSDQLGYLMAKSPNLYAALAFYLIFIAGLLFFVIEPSLASNNWQYALFAGAFFGLVTYATYDLTNLATIRDWPILITAIDLVWGSFVSGSTALVSFEIIKRLRP